MLEMMFARKHDSLGTWVVSKQTAAAKAIFVGRRELLRETKKIRGLDRDEGLNFGVGVLRTYSHGARGLHLRLYSLDNRRWELKCLANYLLLLCSGVIIAGRGMN